MGRLAKVETSLKFGVKIQILLSVHYNFHVQKSVRAKQNSTYWPQNGGFGLNFSKKFNPLAAYRGISVELFYEDKKTAPKLGAAQVNLSKRITPQS